MCTKQNYIKMAAIPAVCASALLAAVLVDPGHLPPPFATPAADNHPTVVPRPPGAQLHIPSGFTISVWAEGFVQPRYLLQGNHGEILLSDSGAGTEAEGTPSHRGIIYVFANGSSQNRKTLIRGLNRPYGLALWRNYLYVAESDSVKRYPYDPFALTVGRGEEVISLKGFNQDHWTRSLLFDRAGDKLYVGIGSAANVETGEDPRRAAINRYNPDGSGHEIFASGTRNPIGLHWYPDTSTLWAAVQERDNLGDDLVPDYFTHIGQGGFYGWPYSYIGSHEDPRIHPQRPDLLAKAIVPDVLFQAHVAVLDFTFYTGQQFPEQYRGGAFFGFHGSWNRSRRVGYEVAFLPFRDGKPAGPPQDFVTGWMLSPEKTDVWGRPVAVFQMTDGSLLVTDDGGRKIWRVDYKAR
jgi:glucose/arabinose dehydrogenase